MWNRYAPWILMIAFSYVYSLAQTKTSSVGAGLTALEQHKSAISPESQLPERPLEFSGQPVPSDVLAGGVFGPTMCDEHGSMYFRVLSQAINPIEVPITRLDKFGKSKLFPSPPVPGLKGTPYVFAFAIDPGGKVYELASSSDAEGGIVYLVALSEKFDYAWSTQIQLPHPFASVFLALPTGDFLIAGALAEQNRQRLPFAGIYGSDGQMKYRLDLAKASGMAADDPKYADSIPAVMGMPFGGDGNIYLLRQGSHPDVYVVSPLGKLVRTFQPQLPFDGARATELFAAQNRILIHYEAPESDKGEPRGRRKSIFALYDMYEGRPIANYLSPGDGMLMCFDGVELSFLQTTRDGHLSIRYAQLQ